MSGLLPGKAVGYVALLALVEHNKSILVNQKKKRYDYKGGFSNSNKEDDPKWAHDAIGVLIMRYKRNIIIISLVLMAGTFLTSH